jgi:hypothetical protein
LAFNNQGVTLNKVIHVPAFFAPIVKEKIVKIPTGEKTKGFFGGEKDVVRKEKQWVQTGLSDCEIDGERLSENLTEAVNLLNSENYEVVSVTPVTSGNYNWHTDWGTCLDGGYGYGYGYGYSYTNSLIIVAKKMV